MIIVESAKMLRAKQRSCVNSLVSWEVRSLSRSDTLPREESQGLPRSWSGSDQQTYAVYRIAQAMREFSPMKRANLQL
jgi:hypothetical protein